MNLFYHKLSQVNKKLKMKFRRRDCKRLFVFGALGVIAVYTIILLFGDFKIPKVMQLTDLHTCPVCYGISMCPELYSNQIVLEPRSWGHIFNAKNIFYGYTARNGRKVILKKLAHHSEFRKLDKEICKIFSMANDCNPIDLLNVTNIEENIIKEVQFDLDKPAKEPRKGLIFCPYVDGFIDFLKPIMDMKKTSSKTYKSDLINVWTTLKLNPEPLILRIIPKSQGWPVPAYGGVCGRLELVAHEGEPLSSQISMDWMKKLQVARHILDMAMDFTYKHERFRFYFMDWSADNIVISADYKVSFIDLEDVIILDKHISPNPNLPDWYKMYSRDDPDKRYTFSVENICKNHISDHNLWAACYVLAGEEPFLYPMEIYDIHLDNLLLSCVRGYNDRFIIVEQLQERLDSLISGGKDAFKSSLSYILEEGTKSESPDG